MIIQGTNIPITITFTETPLDVSVALVNEIQIFKRWAMADMVDTGDGLTYQCPITQTESFQWEEGPCWIEVEWTDENGTKQHEKSRDDIIYRKDKTVLEEE